ncbi:MAG TPA: Nif3-like dinuclear metal center hexameric protein [Methanosarcinaceae archaeon]|nr:Nif3-like dinuclear metal center hexameric protein [Methanosarcinaceae archaeon]
MNISSIIPVLEQIAPPELAEDFDKGKIGAILNLGNDIEQIAVALDPTDYVLNRAADIGADMLITHHTLIFHPITVITKPLADTLKIALDNNISLYSMHTNYDKAQGGVNDVLADRLGLVNVTGLKINVNVNLNINIDSESGRIGEIPTCSADTFAKHVSRSLDTHVQYVGNRDDISRVMVIGGSGFRAGYLDIARDNEVDALVSGELKHDVIRARGDISLIDATHYATENPAMEHLCGRLLDMLDVDVEFIDHNPFINVM